MTEPGGLEWRQSPWDHRVHAYREFGEVTCEAVCGHCAPTSRVIEPLPDARPCLGCQLIVGDTLADQMGDGEQWGGERGGAPVGSG